MIELLSRTAHLAALVIAPKFPSPEPGAPDGVFALVAVLILLGPLGFAVSLYRRFGTLESKAAVGLWVLAGIALLYQANATLASGEPLLRGYYVAAAPVWAAIGATLATLAGQYLGVSFKNKRAGAFVLTIAVWIFIFRDAKDLIASPKVQWRKVLEAYPSHERALAASLDELAADPNAGAVLEACIAHAPSACICRTLRAERALDAEQTARALEETEQAHCDGHALQSRRMRDRALALALAHRYDEAEPLAKAALVDEPHDPKTLLSLALVHEARGDADALDLSREAAARGAGKAAELLVAQLLIRKKDYAAAKHELDGYLGRHPDDPRAVYNAALVSELTGDYNAARQGYLRVVTKLQPRHADARYNLVMLTWRQGALPEAKHHAQRFSEDFPRDPRRASLQQLLGMTL